MFKGSITAIITPFKNNKIDEATLREVVEFQVSNGSDGIVPCGTTGESPTLTPEEHKQVVEIAIDAAAGRVPVIAGTGSNSTAEAVHMTKHAAKAGAQGALVVSPYYNKPSQQGLYEHFKAVAECADLPIILYNIAGRTAVNIETETIAKLARDFKNIVAVKEASGSLSQMQAVKAATGKDFILLSGDDALLLPILSIGGEGVISVAANIVPKDVKAIYSAFTQGKISQARELHYKLLPLVNSLFLETNPVPVKTAMHLLGMCSHELRLPLCGMKTENLNKLKTALDQYGLLSEPVNK